MSRFIFRRFVASIIALVGVTLVIFAFSRLIGDPRAIYLQAAGGEGGYGLSREKWEELGEKLHLEDPIPVQYYYWISDLVRGDLGEDLVTYQPVTETIREKLPVTAKLAIAAWLVAMAIGIPLGVLSAIARGTILDLFGRSVALLGQTVPAFWIALLGILIFSVRLGWLPTSLPGEGLFPVRNMVMPVLTVAFAASAGFTRLTRSAMLEVLDSEYIKLARAKGVAQWKIIWKHAFKNALIPPLTISGLLLAGLMHGVIVIEVIFAWPGLGRLSVESVWNNNFTVLAGTTLFFSVVFIVANFLVDVLYSVVDPRIRYG